MTETELIAHYLQVIALRKEDIYWFFSVTFVLYTVAYLAGRKLAFGTVIFLITAYAAFVFLNLLDYITTSRFINSIRDDLLDLQSQGLQLSSFSQNVVDVIAAVDVSPWIILAASVPSVVAPLGGIGYLIFEYNRGRKLRTSNMVENDT